MAGAADVYAIGDLALVRGQEQLPQVAQVAIQQGKRVAGNVQRALCGAPPLPFVYAERHATAQGVQYVVPPGSRSLVKGATVAMVDDVINAGAAALSTTRALRALGGDVVVLGVLVARASAVLPVGAFGGLPVERLASIDWNLWPAASCPLCAAGAPLSTSE